MVVVRHVDGDIEVPSVVLESCSSVFQEMLRATQSDSEQIVSILDHDAKSVELFVQVATMNTHHATTVLSCKELANSAASIMPLVHKYNCAGMRVALQNALNENPNKYGLLEVLKLQEHDEQPWLSKRAMTYLLRDFNKARASPDYCAIPNNVLLDLLSHVLHLPTVSSEYPRFVLSTINWESALCNGTERP